ncbi:hypothetical protein [Marinomonas sp. THO17]|uniref:hypothetical protein n=1 Tax=Marinomonas sp. THO17 TaxID=3149048 RepID=UPI00336BC4D3
MLRLTYLISFLLFSPTLFAIDYSSLECPDNKDFFTHTLIQDNDLKAIIPLGEVGPSSHTLPVHHNYVNLIPLDENDYSKGSIAANVLAPFDGEVVAVEWNTEKNDWALHLRPCADIKMYLLHLRWLNPTLMNAIGSLEPEDTASFGDDPTRFKKVDIDVNAGDILGVAGGPGITSFDLGLMDYQVPANDYVNPDRYDIDSFIADLELFGNWTEELVRAVIPDRLQQVCGLDYFIEPIQTELKNKLGSFMFAAAAEGIPPCQHHMRDVKGTMAGNWFQDPSVSWLSINEQETLSATIYNIDPELSVIGLNQFLFPDLAFDADWYFFPQPAGLVNRAFEEMDSTTRIFCYSGMKKGDEIFAGAMLALLSGTDKNELLIEYIPTDTCADLEVPFSFQGNQITLFR